MAVQSKELNLVKIIIVVLCLFVLLLGGYQAYRWYAMRQPQTGAPDASASSDIEQAQKWIEEGNGGQARPLLESIVKSSGVTPEALMLLAQIQSSAGETEQALANLKRAVEEFPSSPSLARAQVVYARLLEKSGRAEEAAALLQRVRDTAPPDLRAPALVEQGRKAMASGDTLGAHALFAQAVQDAPWNSADWNDALDELGKANVSLVFSPEPTPESKIYEVKKGDSITSIGNQLNTTQGMLMRANNLGTEEPRLHIGQRLKYTPKDFQIIIERSTCRLFLRDKDGLFKRYYCGLGKPGQETALGSYRIGNKQKDPAWYKPGAGMVAPLAPENELGTRWMPLVPIAEGLPKDLGIHGTIHPETIGTCASNGCARMHKEDVEELYDLIVRSTQVDIVDVYNPSMAPAPDAAPQPPEANAPVPAAPPS